MRSAIVNLLCTHQAYKHAENHCQGWRQRGAIHHLQGLTLLSASMEALHVQKWNWESTRDSSNYYAEAYTKELWWIHQDEARSVQEVINRYTLVLQQGIWMIENSKVYGGQTF